MKEPSNFTVWGRGRGIGRSTLLTQRPANNAISRSGPGMPVPMTGRQKMNEKLRRNNLGISPGPPVSCSMSNSQGGLSVPRSAISSSLGESFKQEIALLQKQLQQNTAELEAKIAMLRESTHSAALYEEWDEDWEDSAFGDQDGHSQVNFVSGDDAGCTTYPLCFDHMANQPALPRSDSQLSSDVQGQTRPKGLAVGTHETVARQMAAPYGDFGQTPMSHVAIIPAQLSQTVPRLIPQLLSEQMPQAMTGQMSQAISGQMPQAMPGQMSHAMPGQMPQAMSEQRLQFAPVQLAQALLDQMAQVLPAQLKPGNHRHLGGMHGPPPGQAHFHRGGSRGGGYYQKTRGSIRGRGKSMSGSDGWN